MSRDSFLHHEVFIWSKMLKKKIIVPCTCNVVEDAHEDLDDDKDEYDGDAEDDA